MILTLEQFTSWSLRQHPQQTYESGVGIYSAIQREDYRRQIGSQSSVRANKGWFPHVSPCELSVHST